MEEGKNSKIEYVPITGVIPYEFNNKRHNPDDVNCVANSILEFGWTYPILIDENNVVLAGHKRLLAANKLELSEVPVLKKTKLTKAQKKAYRILDNKLSSDSPWDYDNLTIEIEALEDLEFNIDEYGLTDLLGEAAEVLDNLSDVEEDNYNAEEDPVQVDVNLGDLIELGNHRVFCGDSTHNESYSILITIQKPELIFTDPPYGINIVGKDGGVGGGTQGKYKPVQGDDSIEVALRAIDLLLQWECPTLVFGGNYFANSLPQSSGWFVWDKQDGKRVTFADCEMAWTNLNCPARIFKHIWDGFRRDSEKGVLRTHPTQKPIKLIADMINEMGKGEVVLDPFLGSGSTLIACEELNRICYGMEIEPVYCQVVIDRYHKYCEDNEKEFLCKINGEPYHG